MAAVVDVAADLRRRIAAGEFQPGDQLPTITDLTTSYKVARGTIDRALRELASEGLVTTRQGKGSFVRKRAVVHRDLGENLKLEFRRALAGDMGGGVFEAMTGVEDVTVVTTYATITADNAVSAHLAVPVGTPLIERTFRHTVNGEPYQIARSYLTTDLAARAGLTGPEVEVPGTGTLMQLHAAGITVQDARFTIEARMPTAPEAFQLAMEPGTPVVEVWRVLNVDGEPVEASKGVIHSDKVGYYLNVDLKGIES